MKHPAAVALDAAAINRLQESSRVLAQFARTLADAGNTTQAAGVMRHVEANQSVINAALGKKKGFYWQEVARG